MKDKIAIIGSGALGTSLAKVLHKAGAEDITIYGVDKNELAELVQGKNTKYFPEKTDIPVFKLTDDMAKAVSGAKYVVIAVPSKVMDKVVEQLISVLDTKVLIINGSKGFYPGTRTSLHQGIKDAAKGCNCVRGVVSLIGPSHAEEIIQCQPTVVASVDDSEELCKEVQKLFSTDYFKVYVQTDVKGAEVGAAYKNILAIAAGMANGLGFGVNTIAALLTRGMAEMMLFNKFQGGKEKTIMGLTGMGDMIVTATSPLSRNFTFGSNFAKEGKAAFETKVTVEGLIALENVHVIAEENNLELPISEFLFNILYGNGDPKDFVSNLWMRKHKSE